MWTSRLLRSAFRGDPGRSGPTVRSVYCACVLVAYCSLVDCNSPLGVFAQSPFEPARWTAGAPPALPTPHVVGSGHVWLRVSVDAVGSVSGIEPLREVAPFGAALRQAVGGWSFAPARAEGAPVESAVLVAAVFCPSALYRPPGLGQPPTGPPLATADIPVPVTTPAPPYPCGAVGSGVTVVEVDVDRTGTVAATRAVTASPGFDIVAVDTARRWRFRPASRGGRSVRSVAYLVFVFREPVVVPPIRRR